MLLAEHCELFAIAGRNEEKAAAYAKEFGFEKYYVGYDKGKPVDHIMIYRLFISFFILSKSDTVSTSHSSYSLSASTV